MSGKRKSVHVEGVSHGAPIPKCELAFANMKTLVENAGGSVDNIGSIKVYMQDRSQRDTVNRPWLKMFPDEEDWPARHAIEYQGFTPGILVQLEIVAVLD